MKPFRSFFIYAVILALAGCGRASGPKQLYLTLDTDKRIYRVGEPIELLLKLNNRSERDTTLEFSSGQRYDFQIVNESGETAWTWSADRSFIQAMGSEQLGADKALEYREECATRLRPGRYAVSGSITTMGSPLTARTTIEVR